MNWFLERPSKFPMHSTAGLHRVRLEMFGETALFTLVIMLLYTSHLTGRCHLIMLFPIPTIN